ncbi:hypothetical protein CMUS01_07808 [Colletotrichum musicola]|uniref:C2H2-type domain-containing protein n=1 Tax=Colletotrichum musicola TaxID=2175873 RepID=A0A8H6NF65_9PEZI|nr:hypothetical protein CMUS01_07808 [Colletotrichum musicola]
MNYPSSSSLEPSLFRSPIGAVADDHVSDDVDSLVHAPAPTIRSILVALCSNPETRADALNLLNRIQRFEARIGKQDAAVTRSPGPVSALKKRKSVAEPRICIQCDAIFTDDENFFGACWYHTGQMELMDETVIDRMPGDMSLYDLDTKSIRERHPEAFRWCCCHKSGAMPGCERGHHEYNPDRSKKGRGNEMSDLDDDPLTLDASYDDESSPDHDRSSSTASS